MKHVPPSVKSDILRRLQAREGNMSQIAKATGVSRVYVRNIALANGITWYSCAERAVRSPGQAERKAREQRAAARLKRLEDLSTAWKAGKTCAVLATEFSYPGGQLFVASLIARLRRVHGAARFPYRRETAAPAQP